MTWRDKLLWDLAEVSAGGVVKYKSSFRGAKFFFERSEASVGRRNVVHQYPYKDSPYIEDLGRDTDDFTVDGYVVQNEENNLDYFTERDALINALKEPGPGILIHPFLGEKLVNLVGKARISESFREGGLARFSMTFVMISETQSFFQGDEPLIPYPKTEADYIESVDDRSEDALDVADDSFSDVYDIADAPSYAKNSIMVAIGSLNNMLKSTIKSIQGAFPSQVSKALAYLAEARAGIDVSAISDACGFANSIGGMFDGLKSIAGMYGELTSDQLLGACSDRVYGFFTGPMSSAVVIPSGEKTGFEASTMESPSKIGENLGKTTVRAMLAVNRFGEDPGANSSTYGGTIAPVSITTYQRARQSANLVAIVNLVRINAVIAAIRTAVRIDYTSYDSAIEMMKEVTDALENLLLKLGNDAADTEYDDYNITIASPGSYQAIESLRSVFTESRSGIGASLAKIVDYEVPPTTFPSLVLAYDRYYDLGREAEIIGRNIPLIQHPGFLPGGRTIEVLNE